MAVNYVDNAALSLIEYNQIANAPIVREVTNSFIKNGMIFQDLPMITDGMLYTKGVRYVGGLPDISWTDINDAQTIVNSAPTPYQEQKWLTYNGIQINKYLLADKNSINNPMDVQTKAYLESVAFNVNWKFFNNNPESTAAYPNSQKSFTGLRVRAADTTLTNPACRFSAGALNLTPSGNSGANTNTLLRYIRQLQFAIDDPEGKDSIVYMNPDLIGAVEEGIRMLGSGGGWTTDTDGYDRTIKRVNGAMVRSCGYQAPTKAGVQIFNVPSTETTAGDYTIDPSNHSTSIFAVKKGTDSFCGTQFKAVDPQKPILLPDGMTMQANFDWMVGLWQPDTRSIGQIYDILITN